MFVLCVRVRVKPDKVEDFRTAVLENARGSRREPGNLRFDVLQEENDAERFFLYEVYHSAPDFAAHQQTAHYLEFKERVADWMAEPRAGVRHRSLFPADADAAWTGG